MIILFFIFWKNLKLKCRTKFKKHDFIADSRLKIKVVFRFLRLQYRTREYEIEATKFEICKQN
ncbi:hypothetical protein BpHYR1_033239 [Brachionus plicatilis]|uniref:Uncharacterized protein n=1 Tax=Brachionus plicatilis TaxID=10195 RepID=A0A3M7REW5_BRAPC|nr:hypothetical protein BpHYR1_033239 [Brachionus plicatilis]